MAEILDLDSLFAQLTLALGLALLAGNGFALYQHRRGRHPADAAGDFRTGRVRFLMIVGLVMTVWGAISL